MGVSTPHFNAERQKESKTMAKTNTTIKMAEKTPEVTPNSSKQSMAKYLADMVKNSAEVIKNTNLVERINYTLDAFKSSANNAPKAELSALVDEVKAVLSAPKKPVEASAKPLKKKSGAKTPEKTDDDEVEKTEDTAKSSKKSEKAEKPAKTNDKGKVQTKKPATNVGAEAHTGLAKMFPKKLDCTELGLGTLIAVPDKYKSFKELRKDLDDGKTLYFVAYWTKRLIKEFNYAMQFDVDVPKEGFVNDLDILQAVLFCDNVERVFAMSAYTEALYRFEGSELEPVEDTDEDGNQFFIRLSNGMEYEIYVPEAE